MSNSGLAKFSNVIKSKSNKQLLGAALTRGLDMDRFIKSAWIQVQTNKDIYELAEQNPTTVFRAMLQCASMGLYPDGISGDAYLVKFGNQCVAIRGYKGLMRLFAESPQAAPMPFVIDTIRENDEWDYGSGTDPWLTHKPAKSDRGEITHYYAVARFSDQSALPLVMSVSEVESFKAYSKTNKFWDSDKEATRTWMRLKTVIRQLMKKLPLAERVRSDLEQEDAVESGRVSPEAIDDLQGVHIEGGEIKKTQSKPVEQEPVAITTPEEAEVVEAEVVGAEETDPFTSDLFNE